MGAGLQRAREAALATNIDPGTKFTHAFWTTSQGGHVRCNVVVVSPKKVTYASLENGDGRVGSCKPSEFPSQIKRLL